LYFAQYCRFADLACRGRSVENLGFNLRLRQFIATKPGSFAQVNCVQFKLFAADASSRNSATS
jgi:hypothetical protein